MRLVPKLMTACAVGSLFWSRLHVPVAQRLHESDQRVLLLLRQPEISDLARVHVLGGLRGGPAAGALPRIRRGAAPEHGAPVVEVHDLLEASEGAIVSVGLDEIPARPLVDIAQWRHLVAARVLPLPRAPGPIPLRKAAQT